MIDRERVREKWKEGGGERGKGDKGRKGLVGVQYEGQGKRRRASDKTEEKRARNSERDRER